MSGLTVQIFKGKLNIEFIVCTVISHINRRNNDQYNRVECVIEGPANDSYLYDTIVEELIRLDYLIPQTNTSSGKWLIFTWIMAINLIS